MNGVIVAGGLGTRLYPATKFVNKHLLSVYDKPMIYYPLTTLILAGVKKICLVTNDQDLSSFRNLLGNGNQFGVEIQFEVQNKPAGIVDAFEKGINRFESSEGSFLILGDNIFFGNGLGRALSSISDFSKAKIWLKSVRNPSDFGVAVLSEDGLLNQLVEKPSSYISDLAVIGMYYFPSDVKRFIDEVTPSLRGELEITSLLQIYREELRIDWEVLPRANFWADAGNTDELFRVSNYVSLFQNQHEMLIGSPEEAALRIDNISIDEFTTLVEAMPNSLYKQYLQRIYMKH